MTHSRPVAFVGRCELVWVEGDDAAQFLQGLVTNDVAALPLGGSCRALLLDVKGRIAFDMVVVRTSDDEFTLVVEGDGHDLVVRLETYHFSEAVTIIGPEPFDRVTVTGLSSAPIPGADLVFPGVVPGTVEAIGAAGASIVAGAGAHHGDPHALDALRIAAGVPSFGRDFTAANLVQEAGLEAEAVSFEKGCYLGQETVSRLQHRGHANRRLVGILLPGPVSAGSEITADGAVVGTLTSVADHPDLGWIGLAILRREVSLGARVLLGNTENPATVASLPLQKAHNSPVRTVV